MKRLICILTAAALFALPTPAGAEFGLQDMEVAFTNSDGSPSTQAGSHPFAMRTSFEVNTKEGPKGWQQIEGALRDLEIFQAEGFAGNPTAVPRCSTLDFLKISGSTHTDCADSSVLGYIHLTLANGETTPPSNFGPAPIFNLEPSPGFAAKLGFWTSVVPVTIDVGLSEEEPYRVMAATRNTVQLLEVVGSEVTLWGTPADPAHDPLRGNCLKLSNEPGGLESSGSCPANVPVRPFITTPRRCDAPLLTEFRALSWWSGDPANPGPPVFFGDTSEDRQMSGCSKLGFEPELDIQPTTASAESPTGLVARLEITDEGLENPAGIAHSDVKKAVVTLPEGVTVNPSQAEGLEVCSEAQLAKETSSSPFGAGCPAASKIGTVEVESPLLEGELLRGSLHVAEPYTNRFGSLLAIYVVIKHPELGISVALAGKVEPDQRTGQLRTTFSDLPELPFSAFRLRFREGGRSPLISPNRCGTHTTVARFTPSGDPTSTYHTTTSFQITSGVGGGPCPQGTPPFEPGFSAGSLSNEAGAYSPFYMRLTRRDGDQDMTKFSSVLPPGVVGKLAGVAKCPDSSIAAAKAKTGLQELAAPSCPADSAIGRTLAGAGVGSQLTYVPGTIHLSGPYNGAPLSVVSITPAVAGPFDAGTVIVRVALRIDPLTAEVKVDGDASDPIPHILQGIPLKVRDLRVYVDRQNFTLNPTSCEPSQTKATLFGSFLDLFSAADDVPVALQARYQAANCASLGFKPRLSLQLKGGTKRGGHPALKGTFRPRPGDANLKRMVLRLPRSAFLDQAHIRTICTRVQFAAEACPKGAIYGTATAFTPLLDQPLSGPVYLRSSDNQLPDFVADLHGLVDVEAVARIDSAGGGIRATFPVVPDAPLTRVVVQMQGAKKGLIVNSRDLCAAPSRAEARMRGHNAKRRNARPVVQARCGGKR